MDKNLIVALIPSVATIIVGWFGIRKRNQQTEVKNEIRFVAIENSIKHIDSQLLKLHKNDDRLVNMEKILIKLEKDIEYLKKDK